MRHQLSPAAYAQATIGLCALEVRLAREVAMNSPLLGFLIVIMLIVASTLSIMNKACKSGYHAWCAPMSAMSAVGYHPQRQAWK